MRLTFVDNLLLERTGGLYDYVLQPHLGLISLIAVAEAGGHTAVLYDPKLAVARGRFPLDADLYRNLAADILVTKPDIVGFTSLGCNFICTFKTAQYLRELDPSVPIVLGGPHATVLDRKIMAAFPSFDAIVRNEGELKLIPLIEGLQRGRLDDIPGISFRNGTRVVVNDGEPVIENLDSLPKAAYSHYPVEELGLSWVRVEAGRGCPFMCTFCSTASFFGRKYRLKSASRLVADLDDLKARYGITHFSLTHDLFTVNRKKVIEFCQAAAGRGYTWKCSARMDCVDDELLETMASAGCREIYYGVETGSPRMQKISQKKLDLSLFHPVLDSTARAGIDATVSFITGYPQEELADQNGTLDAIGSCFSRRPAPHIVQLHLLTPEPGTQLLKECADQIEYDGYVTDFNFPTLESDDSAIMRESPDVFVNHHYYRSLLSRERHIFVTSLYDCVYRYGFSALAGILDCFDGSFASFVNTVHEWTLSRPAGVRGPISSGTLIEFFADRFGVHHYLTSLGRYCVAVSEIAQSVGGPSRSPTRPAPFNPVEESEPLPRAARAPACFSRDSGVPLGLSPGSRVLTDLHDCPAIIRYLDSRGRQTSAHRDGLREPSSRGLGEPTLSSLPERSSECAAVPLTIGGVGRGRTELVAVSACDSTFPGTSTRTIASPVPPSLCRRRFDIVVVADVRRPGMLRNFKIDAWTVAVLRLFETPRREGMVADMLGGSAATRQQLRKVCDAMVSTGVLTAPGSPLVSRPGLTTRSKFVEWGDRGVSAPMEEHAKA